MNKNKELKDLNRRIKENPENIELYCNRADLFVKNKDYQSAIKDCEKILEISPDCARAYLGLSTIYKLANQYEKSIEQFSKLLELEPDNIIYYYGSRGNVKYLMKDFVGAIEDYSKAIDLDTDFTQGEVLYLNRAECYEVLKDYKSALSDYKKVFEFLPDNKDVFYKIEVCRLHLREEWTKEDYLKQIELEPDDYLNYMVLSAMCEETGEFKQADEYLSKCIELVRVYVNPAYLFGRRGDLRVKLNNYDGAIEDYTMQIKLEDCRHSKACILCKRASVYKKQKRLSEAEADLISAIKFRNGCLNLFKKAPLLYIKYLINRNLRKLEILIKRRKSAQ